MSTHVDMLWYLNIIAFGSWSNITILTIYTCTWCRRAKKKYASASTATSSSSAHQEEEEEDFEEDDDDDDSDDSGEGGDVAITDNRDLPTTANVST